MLNDIEYILAFLKITAPSKVKYIGGPENLKNLIRMNHFFLFLNRPNSCMVCSQRLLWWKMKSAIFHLIRVPNLILFSVCQMIPKTIFKDLMKVFILTVTNDREKIFLHSTTQYATEDVLDFRNCINYACVQFFKALIKIWTYALYNL